ncbi:sensor histidine kinase [Pengzhenrongella sicca]|uniref:histidine kinase n=1 Tax=Pengzhenrongella sicca TaxID=2819238 RepID=A0A8A4Z7X9_9MICO|nr:histidine kinase [Pengzhenrongella sicca]QTE27924.1 sensor histidine kinase [Pengzhenrongella sicca]
MGWWDRTNRWLVARAFAFDLVGTAFLLLVSVPTAVSFTGASLGRQSIWSVVLITPLAWRRTRPVASVVAVYTAGLLHVLAGDPLIFPADIAVLIALYSAAVHAPRWALRAAIAGALAGSVLLGISLGTQHGMDALSAVAFWLFASITALAVWAFGLVRRSRRETLGALRDRAERLEVERDQQTQLATSAERARIAREMHDIVAHSLSVIIAQADGGRYAAEVDPAAAARALGTIAETGRTALADMRRLLGVLRVDADGAGTAGLLPQPEAQDLEQLIEQVRTSGLRVSFVRMGAARPLPPGAGLVAYRICQESLTNVLKHAGPDPAVTVVLRWLPAALVLEVSDDGRGAASLVVSDGRGQGLTGMHERAAMFGGTVAAGPRPGGGYRVRAELPIPAVAQPVPNPHPNPNPEDHRDAPAR